MGVLNHIKTGIFQETVDVWFTTVHWNECFSFRKRKKRARKILQWFIEFKWEQIVPIDCINHRPKFLILGLMIRLINPIWGDALWKLSGSRTWNWETSSLIGNFDFHLTFRCDFKVDSLRVCVHPPVGFFEIVRSSSGFVDAVGGWSSLCAKRLFRTRRDYRESVEIFSVFFLGCFWDYSVFL